MAQEMSTDTLCVSVACQPLQLTRRAWCLCASSFNVPHLTLLLKISPILQRNYSSQLAYLPHMVQ